MSKTIYEIHAQYEALKKTYDLISKRKSLIKQFFLDTNPDSIIILGCGSSFQLCESVALSARLMTGVSAVAIPGGDIMLHPQQYSALFTDRPLVFSISRSGSTSEVLNALKSIKHTYPHIKVISVACTIGSEIASFSDCNIEIPWAFDESVCQTRSVTNLYAASMMCLASVADKAEVFKSFDTICEKGDSYILKYDESLKKIGSSNFKTAVVLCDGEGFGVAEEAALAFNEIAYTPSVYKHVLDVRHGPIVLFNPDTLVIAKLNSDGFEYQKELVEDILKRGARVLVVSDEELPEISGVEMAIVFGEMLDAAASTTVLLPVAQLLAYYHALTVGSDPDQPDGLDAWIKL